MPLYWQHRLRLCRALTICVAAIRGALSFFLAPARGSVARTYQGLRIAWAALSSRVLAHTATFDGERDRVDRTPGFIRACRGSGISSLGLQHQSPYRRYWCGSNESARNPNPLVSGMNPSDIRRNSQAARLLAGKRRSCRLRSFCDFQSADWPVLGVDISAIRNLIFPLERIGRTTPASRISGLKRSVIVAYVESESVHFYRKCECPSRNPLILEDYDDELQYSDELRRLIGSLRRIGPSAMRKATLRILVELFWRYVAVESPLPPHEDGATCLFFLTLHNSMVGGEMKLFECSVDTSSPRMHQRVNGVNFYDERWLELVRVIPSEPGNGYLIHESKRPRIMHGCNGWTLPSSVTGARVHMRVSFSVP